MIVAILQARVGSSRLPGKVVKDICGKPMLWHQIQRVKLAKSINKIVIATTELAEDKAVIDVARQAGVSYATGSTDDVLDRIYHAAKEAGATVVVRITGDCPLIDPSAIDQVVEYYLAHQDTLDHVTLSPEWPEGFDNEAFSFSALEQAWREAEKLYERQHATSYIILSGKFRTYRVPCQQDLSHLRLSVDEPVDFDVVSRIYEELYPTYQHNFGLPQILALYQRKEEIFRPNMNIQRNQGFIKSLQAERKVLRHDPKPVLTETNAIWARAERLIPAGTQTLSKGPSQFVQGIAPKYLKRALGCRVWDVDGNEYIDYPMGLGAVSLGHNYPRVNEAIRNQLEEGFSFSMMHPLEVELAELLKEVMPWAEMSRFGKNGSDVTTGAIRAARAITGREKIFHCGYHGWHDWYIGGTSRNRGIPQGTIDLQFAFPYNDLPALEAMFQHHKDEVAVVIMEPFGLLQPDPGYLSEVKELAHANGALLIFDEVATGFRFRLGGMNDEHGVIPDFGCFGKAIGNGLPISAVVGPAETMGIFEELFFSFTFGGECLSLAASIATINEMRDKNTFAHLWEVGSRLQEGYNRMVWDLKLENRTRCVGLAARPALLFLDEFGNDSLLLKSLFQQEILKRGIILQVVHMLSYSHSADDIDMSLAAYYEALEVLKAAINSGDIESFMEGEPVKPVFRPL